MSRPASLAATRRGPLAVLALCALAVPLAAQATTVPLDPKATYLHTNSDNSVDATPIALTALGVVPGQCLHMRRVGDYDNGPGGDTFTSMVGVFSSTSTLLGKAELERVPGALEAGVDVVTSVTYFGSQPTDIPEDFAISTATVTEVTVKVPAGAAWIFLSTGDQLFYDNSDPDADYGIEFTVGGCWTDLGLGLAGAGGVPALVGTGTLLGGDPVALTLSGAAASTSAVLVIGFGIANVPFKGGTLVPTFDIALAGLPTGPAGTLSLMATWPAGLPSNVSIVFQEWIADAGGPAGFAATNGLAATTP